MRIGKKELVNGFRAKLEEKDIAVSKKVALESFEALIELFKEHFVAGNDVAIQDFGVFSIREIAERNGLNPQTAEPIVIPAHKKVGFKVAKSIKQSINSVKPAKKGKKKSK